MNITQLIEYLQQQQQAGCYASWFITIECLMLVLSDSSSVLTSQEDGQPHNFKVTPEGWLIAFDTGQAFLAITRPEGGGHSKVLVLKSVIFLLPQMHDPLDPSVVEMIKLIQWETWFDARKTTIQKCNQAWLTLLAGTGTG